MISRRKPKKEDGEYWGGLTKERTGTNKEDRERW
jgi:hypothetical protein